LKEEVVKAYSIPVNAPIDLINAYLEVKKKALKEVSSHVVYSRRGKAHLEFKREKRRKLRNELLKEWRYSKHYVDSAINSVIGLVKGWIKLYNRGRARSKPEITNKTVYIKNTLFSYRNGVLKISVEPRRRYLEVDLKKYDYLPRDFNSVGGLLLTENELVITFKKEVKVAEPKGWASFDVNLTNITALVNGRVARYDLKKLYHIHMVYEEKRRRMQKLSKHKPKTARRLMQRYSKRERNRAKDFLHKLTTKIAKELSILQSGAILEDLKDIKNRALDKSKHINRKLSKWNARTFQSMLEYKLKWLGLPVRYVNPRNSSKTCPVCQATLVAYRGRLMRCERCGLVMDRDVVAVLNLQMWGLGVAPKALIEALASMMGKRLINQNLPISMKVYNREPRE